MTRWKWWQWLVLSLPLLAIATFLLLAASWQIHRWSLNWVWGIVAIVLVGWRWLLVQWTRPDDPEMEELLESWEEMASPLPDLPKAHEDAETAIARSERELQSILQATRNDPPVWEDWPLFWQRCQELVVEIAKIYHPDVKYPLLNIYIPQAYGLIRGTVEDTDRLMQQLQPLLGQVTVGQAYRGYEIYRQLEPAARKVLSAWHWAQWVFNPKLALARELGKQSSSQANQQLIANLSQLLREVALRNLCQQAIALYGGELPSLDSLKPDLPEAKTLTLKAILAQAEPASALEQKPVNILIVGRTGSGKSSTINALFQTDMAEVNVLPSTDAIQTYEWRGEGGETLMLWDTPGYEQSTKPEFRQLVLDYASEADILLLVNPALDPALQMDADFFEDVATIHPDLPRIAVVTQSDRLRPVREWQPPYDWREGNRPKETNIRDAIVYRAESLGELCDLVLPVVNGDPAAERQNWGIDELSVALVEGIDPAKQARIARFLQDRDAKAVVAAGIIDRYCFQMAAGEGLAAVLKSPILQVIAAALSGSPVLAHLLAEEIPVEVVPRAIAKAQMAYELLGVLGDGKQSSLDLLQLWPAIVQNTAPPDLDAWAFGQAVVEFCQQGLTPDAFQQRYDAYLQDSQASHEAKTLVRS